MCSSDLFPSHDMANMVLVSVFDHAVGEYAPCMCVNSEAAAIRIFTNEVNRYDPNNLLSTNKTDFSKPVTSTTNR